MTLLGGIAGPAGCGGAGGGSTRETGPVVVLAPDDFVMRDVRKDAAQSLGCQVPMVLVRMGPWAGSQGNVTAFGCGYQITYYVACQTSHQCEFHVAE